MTSAEIPGKLSEAVEKLREIREVHDWKFFSTVSEKQLVLDAGTKEILSLTDALDQVDIDSHIGQVCYVKGAALNTLQAHSVQAEELLSKAVKLDPSNIEAWLALGTCLWKKNDMVQAKACFMESISQRENKAAYRELSMITRQLQGADKVSAGQAKPSADSYVQESIDYAKKAVAMDLEDHLSWYYLGNACYVRYVAVSGDGADLKKALTSYKKSEALGGSRNPDLFFNKGNIERYLQLYSNALSSYRQAKDLDPTLEVAAAVDEIESFQRTVDDAVTHGGRIKKKRLQVLRELLTSSTEFSPSVTELSEGENSGRELTICVLTLLSKKEQSPASYLCLDKSGEFLVVSIYFLKADSIRFNAENLVTISNPLILPRTVNSLHSAGSDTQDSVNWVQSQHISQVKIAGRGGIGVSNAAGPQLRLESFDS